MERYRKKAITSYSCLIILVFLNFFAWQVVFYFHENSALEINFFDVGQGDAIFIETPQRHQILIDGGPDSTVLKKLAETMPFWDRSIDLVVLTHPEKDHFAGLIEVLKRYDVKNIIWTGIMRDTAEYKSWLELTQKEGASIYFVRSSQKVYAAGALLKIIYPSESLEGQNFENSNDTSIVAKLDFEQNSFLFTGDISSKIEKKLAENGALLESDVLKAPHHGSKTSSSLEFLEKVNPDIAVISAGRNNSYGHPHKEVLENLAKYDIEVFRTDEEGDIKIISDGKNLRVEQRPL